MVTDEILAECPDDECGGCLARTNRYTGLVCPRFQQVFLTASLFGPIGGCDLFRSLTEPRHSTGVESGV